MKESELIEKIKKGYEQEFNELPENPEFLNQLKAINNEQKPSFLMLWLGKPIPAYSLAFVGLFFFLLTFFFKPKPTELIVYQAAETIIQYDTIVLRDTLTIGTERENSIPKQKKQVASYTPQQTNKKNPSLTTQAYEGEFFFDAKQVSVQQNLSGTSSADSELAQFLGVNI